MSSAKNSVQDTIKVKRLNEKGCSVTLSVQAPVETVTGAFQTAVVQVQSRAKLPGFRAGRIPLEMVKKNFPEHIKERALDNLVREVMTAALIKENLNPVVTPAIKKVDFDENKPFSMEADLEVPPTIEPKNYQGAKVTKKAVTVGEAEINAQIDELREHNARLEAEAEGATVAATSFVIIDIAGFRNGQEVKEYSYKGEMVDMGAPQALAGLIDAIKGAKKGDVRDFETEVRGEKIQFKVTVCEIKKKILPPVDEDFAKEMGFANLEGLKGHVSKAIEREHASKSEQEVMRQIEDHLLSNNTFDIPQSLVEHHLNLSMERLMERVMPAERGQVTKEQQDKFRERIRPSIERDIRVGYLIHAIARKENLMATAADFESELSKVTAQYKNEKEKKQAIQYFDEHRDEILATIGERKVVDFLKSKAVMTEAK